MGQHDHLVLRRLSGARAAPTRVEVCAQVCSSLPFVYSLVILTCETQGMTIKAAISMSLTRLQGLILVLASIYTTFVGTSYYVMSSQPDDKPLKPWVAALLWELTIWFWIFTAVPATIMVWRLEGRPALRRSISLLKRRLSGGDIEAAAALPDLGAAFFDELEEPDSPHELRPAV